MTLNINLINGGSFSPQSMPAFLAGNMIQSESIQYWPSAVVAKSKKGNGLVIGNYTIGDAVSTDLFGHPAIRY